MMMSAMMKVGMYSRRLSWIFSGSTLSSMDPVMAMSSHRKVLICLPLNSMYSLPCKPKPSAIKYRMVPTSTENRGSFFKGRWRLILSTRLRSHSRRNTSTQKMTRAISWIALTSTSTALAPLLERPSNRSPPSSSASAAGTSPETARESACRGLPSTSSRKSYCSPRSTFTLPQ